MCIYGFRVIIKYYMGRRSEQTDSPFVVEVYQKMLANLISWRKKSFNWNRLKCPEILNRIEVGNANSQQK